VPAGIEERAVNEFTVPATVEMKPDANLADAVFDNAASGPDRAAFLRKTTAGWQPVTAGDFADQVRALAAGLIARGVQPGDRIALMSKTRYEWTWCDYAIWTAGAVTVPVYETSSAEQVAWILSDSGAVAAFVETDRHRSVLAEVAGDLPDVRAVWGLEDGGLDELVEAGRQVDPAEIDGRRRMTRLDDLATIIYTSGTTGRPKGCELTHGNLLFDVSTTVDGLQELFGDPEASTLLFLPLAHVFARVIQVGCVRNRVTMGHTADVKALLADFAAFRPSFILSVPRVFEKVYNTAKQKAHADGKGRIFDAAEATAIAYSTALGRGRVGLLLTLRHRLFDRLVFGRLRAALGGRVRYAVSGGAPLGDRLGHFYRGIGVTVLEGYGLTETAAGATMNTPENIKIGTVGRPIPGDTVRIAEDGEILLHGLNVFRGYWHNPTATGDALTDDGFLRTGDIGQLDAEGYLTITGRKKELLVTAGGKNVAPAVLEDRLRAHPLISQCMVVGDNKPFIGALITIDPEALAVWKKEHALPASATVGELSTEPRLVAEIQAAVDEANKAVSQAEAIRKFTILDSDFTEEGGQLTPTLKLKRNVVMKEFGAQVEGLYVR
jgi:long-chain acyl-CoA synthetase